ncbi:MAG: hypothetical protein MUC88_00180 [Planctomycetes bacterium]|nr:hypothetical protein [Planctomycetota bacterium]
MMRAAAALLDTLDIQERDQFMERFVTTVGRTIYTPFSVGQATPIWTLPEQLRVAVHEHTHVVQGDREGWVVYDTRYLASSSHRAGYEAEAYGSDMEIEWWMSNGKFNPYDFALSRARSLKSYACSEADICQAAATMALRAGLVIQGYVESEAAKVAIEWLGRWQT